MTQTPIWKSRRLFFLFTVAAIVALQVVAFGNRWINDDSFFGQALDQQGLLDFMAFRYEHWSGRILVEAALVYLTRHLWLWKLCNAAFLLLLCYATGRLATAREDMSSSVATALMFCLFMLVSHEVLFYSAWWVTGSVNYLWTVALAAYALIGLVERKQHAPIERIGFAIAAALSVQNEQVALVMVLASALLLLRKGTSRQAGVWDFVQVVVTIASAALVFAAPGTKARYVVETSVRFPNFGDLGIPDKISMGLGLVMDGMTDPHNLLMVVACLLALALVMKRPVGRIAQAIIAIAIVFLLLGHLRLLPPFGHALASFYTLPEPLALQASSSRAYALSAWTLFCLAAASIACIVAAGRTGRDAMFSLVALMLGMAAVAMLGFAPTVYASGERVQFVGQMALMLVVAKMILALRTAYGQRAYEAAVFVVALAAGVRVIRLLIG